MPRIDYYSLSEKIAEVLRREPELTGLHVDVEGEMNFMSGMEPWIGVYLDRRDPAPNQNIDAGQSTRYRLRFSIWVWAMSMNSTREAINYRDDILGKVEVCLMKNRKLDDTVDMSWLLGGEMPSGRFTADNPDSAVFLSGGELILLADGPTTTI